MSSQHTDVAAYSFGLLEQQDRLEFEAHLAQCPSCTAELAEFSAMSNLFAGVEPVEEEPGADDPGADEPGDAALGDLVRRRAEQRRLRTRRQGLLAAAACLALLAGGVTAGVAAAPHKVREVTAVVLAGHRHGATDAGTGVRGIVGLEAKAWGTQVTLDLAGVRGPLDCRLVAISRSGERRVIAGWFVPAAGYGVPGHPGHLLLMGGTAIAENDISGVEVDVVHGATLLRISI